jgi:sugar phosphate isomerase/epimerase
MKEMMDMDHVGRRVDHLAELHELWSDGLALLTRPDIYHTVLEEKMAEELEICIRHLEHHMAKDFNISTYGKEINKLNKDDDEQNTR